MLKWFAIILSLTHLSADIYIYQSSWNLNRTLNSIWSLLEYGLYAFVELIPYLMAIVFSVGSDFNNRMGKYVVIVLMFIYFLARCRFLSLIM